MVRIGRMAVSGAVVTLALSIVSPAQVNVTVNLATQYQTIEGFGAYMAMSPWKVKSGPFYVDVNLDAVGFYDSLVSELGVTMWRTNVADKADDFEPSEGVFNPSALLNFGSNIIGNARKLMAVAAAQREPVEFFTSCWSPPSWMKVGGVAACGVEAAPDVNNQTASTCRLSVGMESAYATFLETFVRIFQDSTGKELYGLSTQDEPAFTETYESCWWSTTRYRDVLKIVARQFRAHGLNTGFIAAEDMSWAFPNHYESYIRQDAEALGYVRAWAVHGYTDGVHSDTGAYRGETPTDKPLWQTETSGSGYGSGINDWNGAIVLARDILKYLRDGKMAMWTWWSLQDICGAAGCEATAPSEYCLIANGTPTAKYYASRHFYRFIRPGARQVASTSGNASLQVAAFRHEAHNCVTIVLLNTSSSALTVNLSGSGLPATYTMETSTASAKRVQSTAGLSGIAIPATSIVTLVSGQYSHTEPLTGVRSRQAQCRAVSPGLVQRAGAQYYTLAGRAVTATQTFRAGVYVAQARAQAGVRTRLVTKSR